MQVVTGIIYHFIGGFASGSFYLPLKKIEGWSWETGWIINGFFAWIAVPLIAAMLTVPNFLHLISETHYSLLFPVTTMGLLWGIGGLTFGLAIRYLGMALGMSIVLGFCSAFGSLMPAIYREFFSSEGIRFSDLVNLTGGRWILMGIALCLSGISFCGRAGIFREAVAKNDNKNRLVVWKGLLIAGASGILSACFNFGIETGKPLAKLALEQGTNSLFQNNITFVVLLWGGFTTNFIYCLFRNIRNKSFKDYTNSNQPLKRNYTLAALAGTVWFLQFFFYGMGESKLGNGAGSWILHMSFIILVSNGWGVVLQEWKDSDKKTIAIFATGLILILSSVVLVGYGSLLLN